jgi:hypothetical protein
MKKILPLAAAVLAIAATSVQAQDYQPVGFQTPSGNNPLSVGYLRFA